MSDEPIHKTVEMHNSRIGENVMIRAFCCIRDSAIGCDCKIYESVQIKKCQVGAGSDINCGTCMENVQVGKDVQIAPGCKIMGVTHEFSRKGVSHEDIFKLITIEDGAWIGAGAIILPGVKIGQGAVIGAGAVVNKDIPDHYVYAGTPLEFRLYPIPEDY